MVRVVWTDYVSGVLDMKVLEMRNLSDIYERRFEGTVTRILSFN